MNNRQRPATATRSWGLIVAGLITFTGCSSPEIDEISTRALAHAEQASSVQVSFHGVIIPGMGDASGQIAGQLDEANYSATIAPESGGTVHILQADGATYMRADEQYWNAHGEELVAGEIGDSWIRQDALQELHVTDFVDPLVAAWQQYVDSDDAANVSSENTQVHGVDGYRFAGTHRETEVSVAFTAGATDHGLEQLAEIQLDDTVFAYSQWNEVATVQAPAEDDIFELRSP